MGGLQCTECTLQWFWPTSNSAPYDVPSYSCYAKQLKANGWTVFNFCGWACRDDKCPVPYVVDPNAPRAPDPAKTSGFEEFRNCADIEVLGASPTPTGLPAQPSASPTLPITPLPSPGLTQMPTPYPTPAFPPSTPPTSSTMPTPYPAPVPSEAPTSPQQTPSSFPTTGPVRAPTFAPTEPSADCQVTESGISQSATDEKCQAACRLLPQDLWPCGGGDHPCSCVTARPSTSTSPSIPATTTSTPAVGRACLAAPGLNRGVTDSACARCPNGYRWWPCNEAILCTGACSPGDSLLTASKSRRTNKYFLGTSLMQSNTSVERIGFGRGRMNEL